MARSKEYPDLTFVEPAAWEAGRPSGRPLWIVIHTTEGSEGLRSAEDGASYDSWREDGTSTHYFCDQDTTVQCVLTSNRANAARATGNLRGIHYELCGKAAQNPTQWHDAASAGTIERAAKQAARDAEKYGIPLKHLSVSEIRAYRPGFVEHNDISLAFGESDHSDPGRNYPWAEFLGKVRDYQEDDVATPQENVAEFVKQLKNPDSDLFSQLRAISWKYPVDADSTPRSALKVAQDEDEQSDNLAADMILVKASIKSQGEALARIEALLQQEQG